MIKDTDISVEKMEEMQYTHLCKCGGVLSVAWGGAWGYQGYVLRCGNNVAHSEFVRPFEITMANNADYPGWKFTNQRRKQLEQQVGEERASKLMKYQGRITLTKEEVEDIITTIWPRAIKEAPSVVKRAILICLQYRLNPLMKQLHLLPFKNKEESRKQGRDVYDWAIARGIQADRLLARRQGPFSYIDNTPRRMTDDEQKQIFGKVEKDVFHAIVKLRDPSTNAESTGYGHLSLKAEVYGQEKGNTLENMAFIHAERQALDRLHPGDMPEDVMVVDERFLLSFERVAQLPASKTIVIDTPKVEKTTVSEPVVTESVPPKSEPEVKLEPIEEPPPLGLDMDWLKETLKQIKWNEETTKSWLGVNLKVNNTGTLEEVIRRMDKEQLARFTKEIQNRAAQIPMV